MHDYKFHTLSPRDFEFLSNDLIGAKLNKDVRGFASGRDEGIDGWISEKNNSIIIQSKHWENTANSTLISRLNSEELPKIKKLNPKRYILSVSNDLSVVQFKKIIEIFRPYLKEKDLLDRGKINQLLSRYPAIENKHYKLWFSSTNVFESIINKDLQNQTQFELEKINMAFQTYIKTSIHDVAKEKLESQNCIIIVGAPGVGKTTLSRVLAHELIIEAAKSDDDNYEFIYIESINDFKRSYKRDIKQIFLYDDFLGRNYLSEINDNEGRSLKDIIERIKESSNKKFILTSRISILNQAKEMSEDFDKVSFSTNEELIDISKLTRLEKAKILSSKLFNTLDKIKEDRDKTIHLKDITDNELYLDIIDHKNYNPRLIEYILNSENLLASKVDSFKEFALSSLQNPATVWEKPIRNNLSQLERDILYPVVFTKDNIKQEILYEFITENYEITSQSFFDSLKIMNESFIITSINIDDEEKYISLLNPSIADFLIPKLINESPIELAKLILKMGDLFKLSRLPSQWYLRNENSSKINMNLFCKKLIEFLNNENLNYKLIRLSVYAIRALPSIERHNTVSKLLNSIVDFIHGLEEVSRTFYHDDITEIYELTKSTKHTKSLNFEKISEEFLEYLDEHFEFVEFSDNYINECPNGNLIGKIESKIVEYWENNIEEKINTDIDADNFITNQIIEYYQEFNELDEEQIITEISLEISDLASGICSDYSINIDEDEILSNFKIDDFSKEIIDSMLDTLENIKIYNEDEMQDVITCSLDDDDDDDEDDKIRNLFN